MILSHGLWCTAPHSDSDAATLPSRAGPVCNFFEPNLTTYIGEPRCLADVAASDRRKARTASVQLGLVQLAVKAACQAVRLHLAGPPEWNLSIRCSEHSCANFTMQVLNGGRTLAGQMFRMTTCEITYGPLNCDFVYRADNE